MNLLKGKDWREALVIVAHPDDETIWMGGTIAKSKAVAWTIFSLCRASDPDRAPKFFKVCRFYEAKGIMADLEDEGRLGVLESAPMIEKIIKSKIKNRKFDLVFTHGANGEYGHPRHQGAHLAVFNLIKAKILQPQAAFFFNYKKKSQRKFSPLVGKKNSDLFVKLSKNDFENKKKVMTAIYGFKRDGIDAGYCTNPEAFKVYTPDGF